MKTITHKDSQIACKIITKTNKYLIINKKRANEARFLLEREMERRYCAGIAV
ncbi:hypothetical protein Pcaca04_03580 [Pectobacterium carotovorum subsp. carotovorum]|nr:hypothetical protein Pcaca04_03580 [Pectobacterium carotovorum subsp. carotovorum]